MDSPNTIRNLTRFLTLTLLLSATTGCVSANRNLTFQSTPAGAMVRIDGQNVGETPVSVPVDLRGERVALVEAFKAGYYPEQITLDRMTPGVRSGLVSLVLMEDEAWKFTAFSDATNTWLRVQCDETLEERDAWQKLVDSVTSRYVSLEQMDSDSGYIRSVHEVRSFQGPQGDYDIRTRFVCSMSTRRPLTFKFRIDAQTSNDGHNWVPYERVFLEDAELIEELQGRLGVK